MNKKVYFAGSIRGGRDDASLYKDIIDYINKTDKVLTEHIGNNVIKVKDNKEIYNEDITWLKSADLVIAECTTASLGVGYELGFAESKNIPCYVFYNTDRCNLSAMIKGDEYFNVYGYKEKEEIFKIIDKILK